MKSFALPLITLCTVSFSFFLFSCNNEADKSTTEDTTTTARVDTTTTPPPAPTPDTATLDHAEAAVSGTNADTAVTGSVKFDREATNGKTKMTLDILVPKLASKTVAVHIHEHGDCGDMGKMAHGHWNPTNAQHGKWGSSSFHSGDIGNIKLDSKGVGKLTLSSDLWTLGGTAPSNIVGKAIIVHNGVDDYKTQPTGNSGSRIGCGVIR